MTYFLFACVVLLLVHAKRLARRLDQLEQDKHAIARHALALATVERETRDLDRRCAANNAAFEMLEPMVDNHEYAMQAQAGLSIMHAASMTHLQSQVDEIKRRPFFEPARRDN